MNYEHLAKQLDEALEQEPIRSEVAAILQKHGWYQAVPFDPHERARLEDGVK